MVVTGLGILLVARRREGQMTKVRRKQIEQQVLAEIRAHGGMSDWWITDNQERAIVVTRMIREGQIKLTTKCYPWSDAKILKGSK